MNTLTATLSDPDPKVAANICLGKKKNESRGSSEGDEEEEQSVSQEESRLMESREGCQPADYFSCRVFSPLFPSFLALFVSPSLFLSQALLNLAEAVEWNE